MDAGLVTPRSGEGGEMDLPAVIDASRGVAAGGIPDALQGIPPQVISRTMADRTDEYGEYRKWVPGKDEGTGVPYSGKHYLTLA